MESSQHLNLDQAGMAYVSSYEFSNLPMLSSFSTRWRSFVIIVTYYLRHVLQLVIIWSSICRLACILGSINLVQELHSHHAHRLATLCIVELTVNSDYSVAFSKEQALRLL